MKRGWGVFLDRDGTLVPDSGYMTRPGSLRLYARAGEGLRLLHRAGARLLVVSNQSAVGRGLLDARGLARMDRRLRGLARQAGAPLAGSYYCPHFPDVDGVCDCRKPAPGMLLRGLREHGLDPSRSFLVGDTAGDLEAARAAGVHPVLVLTGRGRREQSRVQRRRLAEAVTGDLAAAARWILDHREA